MAALPRPRLRALAAAIGVIDRFQGTDGEWHSTSDATRVALLGAMGLDASSEAKAAEVLAERRAARSEQPIAPARVVRAGTAASTLLPIAPPRNRTGKVSWEAVVHTESGNVLRTSGDARAGRWRSVPLAAIDAPGFHRIELTWDDGRRQHSAAQTLIVAPRSCVRVADRLAAPRGFGLCANLYSVRDGRSAIGDLTTLGTLCRWAAREGADFVGINPLNAVRAAGTEISPYSPTSRLFRSALYLDLEAVPEFSAALERAPSANVDAPMLDYTALHDTKRGALLRMHSAFRARHQDGATARGRAYRRFVAAAGDELRAFATFSALDEHFGTAKTGGRGWRAWSATFQDPDSPAVRRFAAENADAIDFHQFVQFEIDRQLAAAARAGHRAGLRLGLYQDLPIGALPSGCEEWSHRELFCRGASVGAPPDAFFAGGQNWGLAPIDPSVPLDRRLTYWSRLLRAAFAHAGALRVDHIMGLSRQYWIPHGASARDGAYVRMPAEELFAVLALESVRAGAVVIGEDLGTVPAEIPPLLQRWGVLSSKVLYFERNAQGRFRPPSAYPRRCFVSANTHDLATLPGYAMGRDLDLNEACGVLTDQAWLARERDERDAAVRALRRQTRTPANSPLAPQVYGHLAQSRAALLGVSLDDLGGEVDPVNLPGVALDLYPSWQRRMRLTLDTIATQATAKATWNAVRRRRPRR